MTKLLFPLLLLVIATANAQPNYENLTDEKKADVLLEKLRSNQATDEDKQALKKIAFLIQNMGQDQDENQRQYKKSLATIDKAIVLFDALKDTLNVANNRKFKGYLLGRFGKFPEAKQEIKAAIDLYSIKDMKAGVAVSEFDLARIFEFQNKLDSAIYFAYKARAFWQSQDVAMRVMLINNMLVSLLLKSEQPEEAGAVQAASALLLNKPDMHWQTIIDFYFTSMLLYRTINDIDTAGNYQRLYLAKVAALQANGIAAKSYYEHDR
ncbi:MAG: hypothetical protein ABIU63_04185 [Chitinophagaceae bacterium]